MDCPRCNAAIPEGDVFCEACGNQVGEETGAPLCTCGAAIDDADEEGFCLQCGKRVRPRETDRMEAVLSDQLAAVSDKGKRHDRNEDRFAIRKFERRYVLVVCDGVSTSREPELASALAVEKIVEAVGAGLELEEALRAAALAVAELGNPSRDSAPSTTVAAAIAEDRSVKVGWAGDSRAYWFDDSTLTQLTSDHSWVNEAVAAGEMDVLDAMHDMRSHAITRWLGADAGEDEFDVKQFEAPGDGWLLLCSDGLWNYAAQQDDMKNLIGGTSGTALERCRALVAFANEQGGHDNITAALLRIENR